MGLILQHQSTAPTLIRPCFAQACSFFGRRQHEAPSTQPVNQPMRSESISGCQPLQPACAESRWRREAFDALHVDSCIHAAETVHEYFIAIDTLRTVPLHSVISGTSFDEPDIRHPTFGCPCANGIIYLLGDRRNLSNLDKGRALRLTNWW